MSTTATKPWHRSLSACLFIYFFTCCFHCPQNAAKPAWNCRCITLAKLQPTGSTGTSQNRRGKEGGGGVSYSSDILRKELLTSCQKPATPARLIFYEQINKVSSLCVFIDLCELFACRYLSGGGKTRLGAWVQVPHTSRASGFLEDSGRRRQARSYYSIIIIQLRICKSLYLWISLLRLPLTSSRLTGAMRVAQQRLIET